MTQTQLNRLVARATGENLQTIARRGFSIADPAVVAYDPEPPRAPHVVNWDAIEARRPALFARRQKRELARA